MAEPAARVTAVQVEVVRVDRGLWCTRCMLSSGIRVWLAMMLGDRMHLQDRVACRDCGSGAFVEG